MTWKTWKNHGFHLLYQFVRLRQIAGPLTSYFRSCRFTAMKSPHGEGFWQISRDSDGKIDRFIDLRDVSSV